MVSYISSFFNYLFSQNQDEVDDDAKEEYLAEQLLDLELSENQRSDLGTHFNDTPEIPRNTTCFQKTGIITFIQENNVFIDGSYYFDKSACSIPINVKDKVLYLGYKNEHDATVVVRILENSGMSWEEETYDDNVEEIKFDVVNHVIVGEVDYREERFVYIKDSDLKFNLDDVEGQFVPISGDWLELQCTVQVDEDKPSNVSAHQVVKVLSFKCLRKIIKSGVISEWYEDHGTCNGNMFFNKQCFPPGLEPVVGMKVMVEAIESNQGQCSWRVIKAVVIDTHITHHNGSHDVVPAEVTPSLELEIDHNLVITPTIAFNQIKMHETMSKNIEIVNKGDQVQVINKWIVAGKKRDSQINITPILSRPYRLYPGQTFVFNITCLPKHFGNSYEKMIIMFKGFKIERTIEINIINEHVNIKNGNCRPYNKNNTNLLRRFNDKSIFVPGVKPFKPPNFIVAKIGTYPIPEKIWSTLLGDSNQIVETVDYQKIMANIEDRFPCLSQDLNIHNYLDRWHTLLYFEEVQETINIRVYDMPRAFLIQCQEYLALEVNGLSERRPSLIAGDRTMVKDIWDNGTQYEGYIHALKGDLVLMKFNRNFHEKYSGSDVSIEFHFSRMKYRRLHHALNAAISNLGPEVLFPTRVAFRNSLLPQETLNNIKWYNENLNDGQKSSVSNILSGQCRPKPYCVYGPPGTGKTVTVIETILQIITHFPDSRILVGTPSNSAANLITQRLLQYKDRVSNSFVRILANYLVGSENTPKEIKPYCVTLDIATEGTNKSNRIVMENGINLNCQKSYVGRHRITIGTCYVLGSLIHLGFPKGHFTHIIIDEAGQATEPEIMILLSFIDKENGQIILAGDPMQLGPVVTSRYCKEFGLNESFLSRILETFPYQKDYEAFKSGYNEKLVTLLTDNYRSLEEVIDMPSKLFYGGALVPKIDRNEAWIKDMLAKISEVLYLENTTKGGIFVYGIRGCNTRAEDSPSWFNPQEASMVALTVCKLYKRHITADDIGVITPYVAQARYLRTVFDSMGLPLPKIGTVEDFQGQERAIVLISAVRSSESLITNDLKSLIGFVNSPKRLNVALTRGQVAVMLFCDPHVLSVDPLWSKVIENAVKEDKYLGCDLPHKYDQINEEKFNKDLID